VSSLAIGGGAGPEARFTITIEACKSDSTMSQSLVKNAVHLVLSTKERRIFLRDKEREELHCYITGILKNKRCPLIEINSVGDHVHILYTQSKNVALAKIVERGKASSSGWLKEQHGAYSAFAWQAGYGVFSVSHSHIDAVREYIRGQEKHHGKEDFQTEFRRFCKKNGIPVDERYVWE
jgi:REP element-mobilizing transposase RayT